MTRGSGCYILKFDEKHIKAGKASNLKRRIHQYQGYTNDGKPRQKLLIIKSQNYHRLEKKIHRYIQKRHRRVGRYEIFKVKNQEKLIEEIVTYLEGKTHLWQSLKVY
jgi:hypothetical protein